jgi:hypothetical protein
VRYQIEFAEKGAIMTAGSSDQVRFQTQGVLNAIRMSRVPQKAESVFRLHAWFADYLNMSLFQKWQLQGFSKPIARP